LLRKGVATHKDIVIFDALDGYGGVWNKNKYPGCACNVPAMIYTTSYHVNKSQYLVELLVPSLADKWTEYTNFFATQPQIEEYYTDIAEYYGLRQCTQFHSFVQSCVWDKKLFKWRVTVKSRETGETQHWLTDVLCQCVGSLDRPKIGTTPGRDDYKGTL
jgi:cation diffusion facilitator CzcD-associated flavoprotein CzcO